MSPGSASLLLLFLFCAGTTVIGQPPPPGLPDEVTVKPIPGSRPGVCPPDGICKRYLDPLCKTDCDCTDKEMKCCLYNCKYQCVAPMIIVMANELVCRGLDKLESTLPILQQPADKVVSDAKSLVTGARDAVFGAVTSTATGARDTVTGALSGVVGLAGGTIQGSISATQSVVSTVMESHVGQFVTSSIDAVLGKTEEWMDHYLPMTDEELSRLSSSVEGFEVAPLQQQREQQSYYVRLGSLSSRIRHRAYQHSLGKVRNAQALDSRVLGMTQMMTKQLQTTCFTLVSGAQGLPANIQEHVQQLRQNVQELHTSFSSVWSLGNLSSRILAQSRAKVNQHVQELFDYMLVNLPLTRVVGPFAPQLVERPETPETQQTSEAQQE